MVRLTAMKAHDTVVICVDYFPTCTFLRLASSAFPSALISTRGALMYRNLVVEIKSELNGLLIPMEILLRTILMMRVSSRSL